MSDIIDIGTRSNSCVSRVSVQVSQYSEANGGSELGTGTLFAVETLFTDGTWLVEHWHRDLQAARDHARAVADDRGAVVLINSMWPNRQVIGGVQ
ncbi:hypothetical protein [Paracoccus sp. SM22M-07]|uniref:hypothetical protein n=1 Tax=Paracoccus sp. SM22M-07 TaxID=1520813 RepID=UPI000920F6FF|nr:hypothetical protein [Paracoccus sp. SM22M-07]OJH45197.1 hypothetical protein IE00_05940 [Paracoccus sp. SM22M-07]